MLKAPATPRVLRNALLALILMLTLAPAAADARQLGAPPPGYDAAEAQLRRDGRELVRRVAAGDGEALFARFTPAMAQSLPRPQLDELLAQLAPAPLGGRLGESALPLGRDNRTYAADHRWGADVLAVELVLDRDARIAGLSFAPRTPLPPDPAAGRRPQNRLRLPLLGTWWVFWGGPDERRNYHVVSPDQRHAYDLVRWRRGATHRAGGARNAHYYAWNRRAVAPAAGVVVAARDGVRDNRPGVERENAADPAGNHVLLDLGRGEYALLAHLRRGTVRPEVGDRVRAGRPIGRVGNSGNSSEPHLHFHLQDSPRVLEGTGLPVTFRRVVVDGRARARSTPEQAQFVAPAR